MTLTNAAEILQVLSAISIGLLIGALLTEGCILVPHWRSVSHDEFHALYRKLHPILYRYFTPVTVAPLLLSLASGITSWLTTGGPVRAAAPFALCLIVAATHELYFKAANTKFAAACLDAEDLALELRRWAMWHWARTTIGFGAFCMAVVGLRL